LKIWSLLINRVNILEFVSNSTNKHNDNKTLGSEHVPEGLPVHTFNFIYGILIFLGILVISALVFEGLSHFNKRREGKLQKKD
jgi:hypothetical protein